MQDHASRVRHQLVQQLIFCRTELHVFAVRCHATLGEIDRTSTQTTSYGASLQGTDVQKIFGHDNRFVIGGSFDYGITNFGANAQLSTIGPGFVLPGGGPFLGESGNPVSDGPVALRATNAYTGLYAFDAFDVTKAWTVTAGGRLNVADVHLRDQLGTALNGDDRFIRFNPMIGTTYRITNDVTAYAGYSEANRAPTPLELGCANPLHPCIIGSFLVSDPPLKQVVARTYEAGLRGVFDAPGGWGTTNWKLGAFRTDSQNDIMNVPSPTLQGFGYFTNVGATRRQGIEAQVDHKFDKLTVHLGYAYVDATFQTPLTLSSNSPFADANGFIFVKPGDRVPMIPQHRAKFSADYELTPEIKLGTEVVAVGSQYFAGDASNQAGQLPAYAVVNLDASYKITKNIELYAKMENALGARYYSYGTFFDTNQVPNFAAGGAPFTDPRTVSPAQPRSVYAGMKATF